MKSRAWLVVVLFLLVSTPLTGAVEPVASKDFINASDEVNAPVIEPLTEAQRLAIAKEHWSPMPAATMVESSLKPSSGLVHQAAGSFDPLLSTGPTLPSELTRAEDMAHTGLVIVQLNTPNGDLMQSIAEDLGLTVLDASGDEAWLLRLPERPGYRRRRTRFKRTRSLVRLSTTRLAIGSIPRRQSSLLAHRPSPAGIGFGGWRLRRSCNGFGALRGNRSCLRCLVVHRFGEP